MWQHVSDRLANWHAVWRDSNWYRWTTRIVALASAYDLLISQVIPTRIASELPKLWEFVAMTSGFLPWWGWVNVFLGVTAIAAIEQAIRVQRTARSYPDEERSKGDPPAQIEQPLPPSRGEIKTALGADSAYLSLEAHHAPLPKTSPQSGRMWLMTPRAGSKSNGLKELNRTPGTKQIWPKLWGDHTPSGWEFRITNHGSEPVFRIEVPIVYRFLEAVIDGRGLRSGAVIETSANSLYIEKINPGEANAFVCYATNYTGDHVHLTFGPEATVEVGRATQRVNVPLRYGYSHGHFLTPSEDTLPTHENKKISEN